MFSSRLFCNVRVPRTQAYRSLNFFNKNNDVKVSVESEKPSELTVVPPVKIEKRILQHTHPLIPLRQAWVENLDTIEPIRHGIIDLHHDVFGVRPRIDLIDVNIKWQLHHRLVNYSNTPWQHEIKRSNRKPWPIKCGRAHHGTRRSHIFKGGVKLFGPHGPRSFFYMLRKEQRALGLCNVLSVKLAQDDLHIVNNLEVPSDDPDYLLELAEYRNWGPSVLFVDIVDIMPKNIALATHDIKHMNLMPVYGLNCYSMIKHTTVVLTLDAVNRIEERLLNSLRGPTYPDKVYMRRAK